MFILLIKVSFYVGLVFTVYLVLLLFSLIKQNYFGLHWLKYPFYVLRSLFFLDATRKMRACVIKLWIAKIVLGLSIVGLVYFQ